VREVRVKAPPEAPPEHGAGHHRAVKTLSDWGVLERSAREEDIRVKAPPVHGPGHHRPGIPTMYRGVRFRSRLEATWACFFDQVGWPWKYEPIDLDGYIPDFILPFQAPEPYGPVLVEIKPETRLDDLRRHTSKLQASGWKGEMLLLGAGPLGEAWCDLYTELGLLTEDIGWDYWDSAVLHECGKCKRPSFHHQMGSYACRVNGCHDGRAYHKPLDLSRARALWATAQNATQWKTAHAAR
jgi:hypothetical protein